MKNVPFEIQRIGARRGSLAINLESIQYLVDQFNGRGGEQLTLSVKKVKANEPVEQAQDGGEGGGDTTETPVADSEADSQAGVQEEAGRSGGRSKAKGRSRRGGRRGK